MNCARRFASMLSHSFTRRAIVLFDAAPAPRKAFRAASVPCPERVFKPFPAAAALADHSSSRAERLFAVARVRDGVFLRRAGALREAALRRAGALRRFAAAAGA